MDGPKKSQPISVRKKISPKGEWNRHAHHTGRLGLEKRNPEGFKPIAGG
jgi:hypothetical protein